MREKFYFDELYARLNARTQDAVARAADGADRWIIAGMMVRGTHSGAELLGRALTILQTGNVQIHAFLMVAGLVAVLFWVLGS
jgi:NADH:ubiquinone oxidoreductase subunit 5 (subunit L)/multisubunit Na+/H+ antiporter MnhA subunit